MVGQLGGTLCLISIGWIGKGIVSNWWRSDQPIDRFLDTGLFLILVLLSTLIGGLLPKALVLNRPEVSALKLAPVLEAVMKYLSSLLVLLESIVSILLRLLGLNARWDSLVPALSAEELETLIETGGVTGLRPDERNILEGVFALRDTQVREVMVPRSGMETLNIDATFSELMKAVHKTRHARFLVIGDSLDDVRGLLDLRQLAEPISKGVMNAETPLAPFLQVAPTIEETATLGELLPIIRSGKPLLLVVDEHGGTEGLITATDLTGEIVGDEIQCSDSKSELRAIDNKPGEWLAEGNLEIIELNRQLNLELPEADDHHTLAGFLLERLQHVPSEEEYFSFKGTLFEIQQMKGPRIEKVRIVLGNSNFNEIHIK